MRKIKIFACVIALLLLGIPIFMSCQDDNPVSLPTTETPDLPNTDETGSVTTENNEVTPMSYRYKNASFSENGLRINFGVLNEINLFEPNTDIPFYVTYSGERCEGKSATIIISGEELATNSTIRFDMDGNEYIGSFKASRNGVYRLTLTIDDLDVHLSFRIGVVPRVKTANDSFLYSCQPCVARLYTHRASVIGQTASVDRQVNSVLKTIEYMGFNGIREDAIYWLDMQPNKEDELNLDLFDQLLEKANAHNQALIYIIGTPPVWAYKEEYKDDTEVCYNVCPEIEYWEEFCRGIAEHTKDVERGKLIWQIWNEPDGEFFYGTAEEFCERLEVGARTIRKYDPDAYIIGPGLVAPTGLQSDWIWYKDTIIMAKTIKKLMDEGALDTYAHHLHYPFNNDFFDYMADGIGKAERLAGLVNNGAFNTESGVCSHDKQWCAEENVAKALYFRTKGYKNFTVYSFADGSPDVEDGWSMFNGYLQPNKAAIAYAAMLNLVGQATEYEVIAADRALFANIFYDGEKSVVTVYYDGEEQTPCGELFLPEGKSYQAYDLFGNKKRMSASSVVADSDCIYLVYEGKISASEFTYNLGYEE